MLYSEQMKQIGDKLNVNLDELPDGLYSTFLSKICDACGTGGTGGGGGGASSWDELSGKPFGATIAQGVALELDGAEVDINDGYVTLPYKIQIIGEEQYTVVYNGTTYNCTSLTINEEGIELVVLGNVGAMMGEEGTGEPFVFVTGEGQTIIYVLDGLRYVTMTITGLTEVVDELEEKYIRSSIERAENRLEAYVDDKVDYPLLSFTDIDIQGVGQYSKNFPASAVGNLFMPGVFKSFVARVRFFGRDQADFVITPYRYDTSVATCYRAEIVIRLPIADSLVIGVYNDVYVLSFFITQGSDGGANVTVRLQQVFNSALSA